MKHPIVLVTASSLVLVTTLLAHHVAASPEGVTVQRVASSRHAAAALAPTLPMATEADAVARASAPSIASLGADEVAPAATTVVSTEPTQAAAEAARQLSALELSVESSIFGRLDAAAVMDLAETLLAAEVDPRANPVPDPTGSMFFPLEGVHEGLQAELKVAHSTVPEYANVLGLEMKLVGEGESRFLDGVMREAGVGRMQVWTGHDGRVLDMSIQTLLEPDYDETLRQGLSFMDGTVRRGVLFHYDAQRPEHSSMSAYGFIDGEPHTWSIPLELSQGEVDPGQVNRISEGLLRLYADVRER